MPARNALRLPSKRLILSYIFDWIVIIGIAAVGAAWDRITPYHRPFSLVDLSISYPYVPTIEMPIWLLTVICLLIPAGVIFLVCLIFVPGPGASKNTPASLVWRRKLWEWNTGWMGLGLSLASALLITSGTKQVFGKPRPDLLARCQPDLANIAQYVVGGFGQDISQRWTLVSSDICQQTDLRLLNDGFRSFPSGHSSFSWAGLLYLTLFLASKFQIAIPYLPPRSFSRDPSYTAFSSEYELENRPILPTHHNRFSTDYSSASSKPQGSLTTIVPIRNQAAAPPLYLLVLAFLPIGVAIYICSTRYTDYQHSGIDIIAGSLLGILTAWFSFRWYHLPISRGAGWSWGARSRDRAWGIPNGVHGYVGGEGWASAKDSGANMNSRLPGQSNQLTGPGVMDGNSEDSTVVLRPQV